ncbi:hypothetical protein HD806DRAFT_526597 [Xylariaceae sp. AK1471]|nr:hypothetical protein HD806DRAFT_526597 [Xylariaceae sp. AK1471]
MSFPPEQLADNTLGNFNMSLLHAAERTGRVFSGPNQSLSYVSREWKRSPATDPMPDRILRSKPASYNDSSPISLYANAEPQHFRLSRTVFGFYYLCSSNAPAYAILGTCVTLAATPVTMTTSADSAERYSSRKRKISDCHAPGGLTRQG